MNHRNKILTVVVLVLAAALLLWWWLGRPTQQTYPQTTTSSASKMATSSSMPAVPKHTPQTAQALEEKRKGAVAQVQGIFATPIEFYGKVIDQHGDPVPDANIEYGVIDKFYASGSDYKGKSDANGNFSISGIKGAVLTVAVVKYGYHYIHGKSNGSFGYGMGPDSHRKPPPTKENPAVFVLQKMGDSTEPLIKRGGGQVLIPRTGQPLGIDLSTGRPGGKDLEIQTWIGDSTQRRFDWRFRLNVPGGGLVERKGEFDFEAPADGYQPSVEMNMPANMQQWSADVPKEYFAKLADGRYARFSIEFYAGNRNFVVFTSYLNPKPGSRNLEFDPNKAVQSP